MEQHLLFGPNFLEKLVGQNILFDRRVALLELIANSWDAGAKNVQITWPTHSNEQYFSISDDGEGLAEGEFIERWRTLAYDRIATQGSVVIVNNRQRRVFGRNGIGRFAGFCFGDEYLVKSKREGYPAFCFRVKESSGIFPFTLEKGQVPDSTKPGTTIEVTSASPSSISEEEIMADIGMRFLTDPSFSCYVNGTKVDFSNIPDSSISEDRLTDENGNEIVIKVIDTIDSDKTTKQHGVAWHVKGRLVGDSDWRSNGLNEIVDGRSAEAKRHTFIVNADFLNESVSKDWTGFLITKEFRAAKKVVFDYVKEFLFGQSEARREKTLSRIEHRHQNSLGILTSVGRERWKKFMRDVQRECTSINETDLGRLAAVLINLEKSNTKYELIEKLHELNSNQLDDLTGILSSWTLDIAKEVLDELELRIKLIDELRERVFDTATREVQDLQPLFFRGLWIFGPEYETIEFTSNEGMTRVIQKLFSSAEVGSKNRPDFAVLPNSSVGLYSYPTFDEEGGEQGVERLVIVELKKPGIAISTDEKAQCWKYVSEILKKGLLGEETKVTCFVLGSEIDGFERLPRKENNDRCVIQPLDYQVVLQRAKSRLLKLYDKVSGAPFLETERQARWRPQQGFPLGSPTPS